MSSENISTEVRREIVRQINDTKDYVSSQAGFYENSNLRAVYVTMLTVEGAVMFDDIMEFSDICLKFCRKKERQVIEGN